MNRKFLSLFVIAVCWTPEIRRYENEEATLQRNIEKAVLNTLACNDHIPGLSLAVTTDRLTFSKGYGFTDFDRSVAVDENTTFGIASLTKAFTATLALLTLKRHGLSPEVKIREIFGNDFRFNDSQLTKEANVYDLLSHTLGIPGNNFIRYQTGFTRRKLYNLSMMQRKKTFREFLYSNLNYAFLAHVTETLANKSWESMMYDDLLKPCGMTSTFLRNYFIPRNVTIAKPHVERAGRAVPVSFNFLTKYGALGGSGSVMTSARDMSRWLRISINRGLSPENVRVLPETVVAATQTPRVQFRSSRAYISDPEMPVPLTESGYAAGWKEGSYRGHDILLHSGATHGYTSCITVLRKFSIGLYTAVNSYDIKIYTQTALHLYVLDMLLGERPWIDQDTLCSYPQPWTEKLKCINCKDISLSLKPKRNLAAYSGMYGEPSLGNIFVYYSFGDDHLFLKYGYLGLRLYPTEQIDKFGYIGDGATPHVSGTNITFICTNYDQFCSSIILHDLQPVYPPIFNRL